MATHKDYQHLEPNDDPTAEAAARALEAQIPASQESRRAELDAALAAERAEQERLRDALKESEGVAADRGGLTIEEQIAQATARHDADREAADREAQFAEQKRLLALLPERPPAPPVSFAALMAAVARLQHVGYYPPARSAGQRDPRDAVDHVVGDGLAREQGEQLVLGQSEASTGVADAAALEGSTHERTEQNGRDAHALGMTFSGQSVNQQRLQDLELEWTRWFDSQRMTVLDPAAAAMSGQPIDLQSMSLRDCEGVEATAVSFTEGLLDSLCTSVADSAFYARRGEEALQRWKEWFARRPRASEAERQALQARFEGYVRQERDFGSQVQIVEDRAHMFPGGDVGPFAAAYVKTLPLGWSDGVVLSLHPGAHVVVCRWRPERLTIDTTRDFCRHGPRLANGEPRFAALKGHNFGVAHRVVVPVAAPTPTVSLQELTVSLSAKKSTRIHSTGIGPLDAVFATGGIPTGARVVVQAATGQGKSVLMLEIAESFAARGLSVLWLATGDDHREAIQARRRQRLGMLQGDALTSTDESGLNPNLRVGDGRVLTLEQILQCKDEIDLLIVDPVTKVRSACTSSDTVAQVAHALDLIEGAGVTALMSVPTVRRASKRTVTERGFGGQRIESGAHVLVELVRKGSELTLSIGKSRYGGEGLEVPLRLDAARQCIVDAAATGGGAPRGAVRAEDRIRADVRRVLAERGPRSVRSLTDAITGKAETVRAVIKSMVGAGELLEADGKVRLP